MSGQPTRREWLRVVTAGAAVTAAGAGTAASAGRAAAAASSGLWFDTTAAATLSASGSAFVDGYGRQVVLRGFNVSGETKLAEHGLLPFASVADAQLSAAAMKSLTGANAVRFLVSWAGVEPTTPGTYDETYLAAFTAQLAAFLDAGLHVYVDCHQDLFSRYLFTADSWWTGDGAPAWLIAAGGYPAESCVLCVLGWSQNMYDNAAVQDAMYDFWHNRTLTTSAGSVAEQTAFLGQAQALMAYLESNLTSSQFARITGFDPFNEPYAGNYDSGQSGPTWERDILWPFYQEFRTRMNSAGWGSKVALVEPNVLWNQPIGSGGFVDLTSLGSGYAFNSHYYDGTALYGFLLFGAGDGQYVGNLNTIRTRASALGVPGMVSEFGNPMTGTGSSATPTVLKAMYQALDSSVSGANWWTHASSSGTVLSGTQWHWDIYSGRHHELMNGNTAKVQTTGDGWNSEDFSQVALDSSGAVTLRTDQRLLDRIYPVAVAGSTLAFTYEDRAGDGTGTTLTWNAVPSSMTTLASLVGTGQYGVLVWTSNGAAAPTELHLPASFATTTVVTDLGSISGPPAYTATGQVAAHAVAVSGARLFLTPSDSGVHHVALVTNGASSPTAATLAAAQQELVAWMAGSFS